MYHEIQPNLIMFMYKENLSLNNLQWLMCPKTQPNQVIYMYKVNFASKANNGWYGVKPNQTKSYVFNMYKEGLALNNVRWLICNKTQPNQILYI